MRITRLLFFLVISLGVVFVIHLALLNEFGLELLGNRVVLAYIGNLVLTAAIVIFLSRLPSRFTHSLGYLFLFGSAIKFVFFFVFFFPFYRLDGDISKQEFITFFCALRGMSHFRN